jgi:hypothetical protein
VSYTTVVIEEAPREVELPLKEPLEDCPLCDGVGDFLCDDEPNRLVCACRFMNRADPTLYEELRKMREEMMAQRA